MHGLLFPSKDSMASALSSITFAPGILATLQAVSPPKIAAFKALPTMSGSDEKI
jgi:hypothetical protein